MSSTVNMAGIAEAVGEKLEAIERGRDGRLNFLDLFAKFEAARELAATEPEAAAEAYESIRERFESPGGGAFALEAALEAAMLFNRAKLPAKALDELGYLTAGIRRSTSRVKIIQILLEMGAGLDGNRQWAEAAETYSQALELARATGDIGYVAQVSMTLAAALARWGRPVQAEAVLAPIALTDDPAMPIVHRTRALLQLAKLRKQNGDRQNAASALSMALKLAGSSGDLDALTKKRIALAGRRLGSML